MSITLSLGTENSLSHFVAKTVSFEELELILTSFNWSSGQFTNDHRKRDYFERAEIIGLDIDEGLSLAEALELFKPYKHLIGTSKSHQKEKNGKVCDRFRVVLFFETPIISEEDWDSTWHSLKDQFPFIDPACKDPSRFYYPCQEMISAQPEGQLLATVKAIPKIPSKAPNSPVDMSKAKLSRSTLDFLIQGAPDGDWHRRLFKAAMDWKEQGLDQQSFEEKAVTITGYLDRHDEQLIQDVFQNRDPKYLPRAYLEDLKQSVTETEREQRAQDLIYSTKDFFSSSINFLKNKDQVYGQSTGIEGLDGLLGGGKRLGEITALTATAKAGKSALSHFLIHRWLKQGIPVGFASREMSPETEVTPNLLSLSFQENAWKADMTEERVKRYTEEALSWPIYYTRGYGYLAAEEFKDWALSLKKLGVNYFVLDHLLYAMSNPEDFKEVSLFMREIKKFVNEERVHLDLIIQPRSLQLGEKIGAHSLRGGANISQAINTLLTLERIPDQKNVVKLSLEIGRSRLCKQGSIYLQYNSETTEFFEVEEVKEPEPKQFQDFGTFETFMGKKQIY